MNLLIITQKVDRADDILGFFHAWIQRFSENCTSVVVVCLEKGECNLPQNVRVLSLGKEGGTSRIKYAVNFYRHIIRERKNYDVVFIHMNPIYVVLGGLFWKLWNKKCFLWFNHPQGTSLARLAITISDRVFCTSPFAFSSQFKKTKVMPAGIDTEIFKDRSNEEKAKRSILYLGRISPIKRIELLIEAAKILDRKQMDFVLHITGSPMTEDDVEYEVRLKEAAEDLVKEGTVKFFPKVRNSETPGIYNQNEIFVNLTPTGSFDKTVLEAMACETLTLVSNRSFEHVIPEMFLFKEGDPYDLADRIEKLFLMTREQKDQCRKQLRNYAVQNHNLGELIKNIITFSRN